MAEPREDAAERIRAVAELLGLSPEQLIIAAVNGGASAAVQEAEEPEQRPPPIVYPNIKFPRYKFREYPKLVYRGYIRDVEEPILKLVPNGQGGVNQVNAIRIIPDQFVMETREVKSKAEEATLSAGWYFSLSEAKDAAKHAKNGTRPIVEKIVEEPDEDGVDNVMSDVPLDDRKAERARLVAEMQRRGLPVGERMNIPTLRKHLGLTEAA